MNNLSPFYWVYAIYVGFILNLAYHLYTTRRRHKEIEVEQQEIKSQQTEE